LCVVLVFWGVVCVLGFGVGGVWGGGWYGHVTIIQFLSQYIYMYVYMN